jgi:drug/metabolite transporter (DMT)-like permease
MRRGIIAGFVVVCVLGLFVFGFHWARDTTGSYFGLGAALMSAAFWALGSLFADRPTGNMRLNLFAALAAAGSAGFLSPAANLCGARHILWLCG